MGTNDLPPIGTLWGDIPPEVRERLPVGTVLGPSAWYPNITGPLTRSTDGLWRSWSGAARSFVHSDRPILSYPTYTNMTDSSWETAPLLPLYDTPKAPPMSTRPTPICHKTIAPSRETYETAIARASDCIGSNCSLWHASDALPGCGRCSEAPHATPWPDPFTQEQK